MYGVDPGAIFIPCHFLSRSFSDAEKRMHIDMVKSILSCRLDEIPLHVYSHRFITSWQKSAKMKSYLQCMRTPDEAKAKRGSGFEGYEHLEHIYDLNPKDMESNETEIKRKIELIQTNSTHTKLVQIKTGKKHEYPFYVSGCLPLMIKECKASHIVAVKSIRFYVDYAVQLHKEMPDLTVIHYSRDPRGIITSRKTADHKVASRIAQEAESLCQFMVDNIESQRKFSTKSFMMSLKYEDLATDPLNITRKMYNFIREEPSKDLLKIVHNHTQGGKFNGLIGTSRYNSTATSIAWKQSLPEKTNENIIARCNQALIAYDYDI